MKKVLICMPNLGIGGIETFVYSIVSNLKCKGYKFDVLVIQDYDPNLYYVNELKRLNIEIIWAGSIRTKRDKKNFLNNLKWIIREQKYDIVHSHLDFLNIGVLKVAKKCGVKIRLSHVHTILEEKYTHTWRQQLQIAIKKILLAYYATACLGCSKKANSDFYLSYKSVVITNGIDLKKFEKSANNMNDPYQIVHVGRMTDAKNPKFICEIFKELVKLDNRYKLIWVGDGEKKAMILSLVQQYNLTERVSFVGARTDVEKFYACSSIFLLPSIREGLPFSVVEAQAAGLLCFVSDNVTEEVNCGRCYFLSLENSASVWANEINNNVGTKLNIDNEKMKKFDQNYMLQQIGDYYG